MTKFNPADFPVGAKFTRTREEPDYRTPPNSDKYGLLSYLAMRKVVKRGVLADPNLAPPGEREPRLGGALFGPAGNPYAYVKWDNGGYGSTYASEIVVDKPTPDEAKAQAEALLEKAGFTLIAIDNVANATKLSFNEGVLRLAGIHSKEVEFRYTKADTAPVETRRLLVDNVESHGDAVLVGGRDPDRGAYRNFRLDRIKGEVKFV